MHPAILALSDMGATFDTMNRTHRPTRHVPTRTRRRDTLANTLPIVGAYLLAAWADGWSSAPLITN